MHIIQLVYKSIWGVFIVHFVQTAVETVQKNPDIFDRIMEIVERFGFPVLVCGALFWYLVKLEKQHKEEMDAMRIALEQNTIALTKLTDKLGD